MGDGVRGPGGDAAPLRAWVAFSGQTDRPWLRILRPGFRHCYALLHDGRRWLSVDPMLNHMELRVYDHVPEDFDLPQWLRARGQIVVEAPVDHSRRRPAPFAVFTCVEAVKRVLGLHRFSIMTPWQLYRHLGQTEFHQGTEKEKAHG